MGEKYALVTGASTGIGRAVAVELANNGFTLILIARSADKLQQTLDLIKEKSPKSMYLICDLSSMESINSLSKNIKDITSELNVLVNVAGIWHGENEVYAGRDFEDFEKGVITDTLSVGLISPMIIMHDLIPIMPKGASIINISGTFANGGKGWLPYFVGKRAMEDLTLGLSQELTDKDINVNCISPSDTATEEYIKYFPDDAKDANKPEDIAKAILALINSGKTGEFVVVKKGETNPEGFHK